MFGSIVHFSVLCELNVIWVTVKGALHGDMDLFLCVSLKIYHPQNVAN